MCTIQNPKKRFDYDAYIQGRLIGKYVVIYHDEVPAEPEIEASEAEATLTFAQPLILIKTDDNIQEPSVLYVNQVEQSYLGIKLTQTGVSNRKILALRESHWISGFKPNFPNSRAGPY